MDQAAANPLEPAPTTQGLVLRNAMFLGVAQVLGMPLSILITLVMGHYLNPQEFGYMYLAGSFIAFGAVAVEWGQNGAVPAEVAKDRTKAGDLLGSAIAWRAIASIASYAILAAVCY